MVGHLPGTCAWRLYPGRGRPAVPSGAPVPDGSAESRPFEQAEPVVLTLGSTLRRTCPQRPQVRRTSPLPTRMRTCRPYPTKLLHLRQNAMRSSYGMRVRVCVHILHARAAWRSARAGSARRFAEALATSVRILSRATAFRFWRIRVCAHAGGALSVVGAVTGIRTRVTGLEGQRTTRLYYDRAGAGAGAQQLTVFSPCAIPDVPGRDQPRGHGRSMSRQDSMAACASAAAKCAPRRLWRTINVKEASTADIAPKARCGIRAPVGAQERGVIVYRSDIA